MTKQQYQQITLCTFNIAICDIGIQLNVFGKLSKSKAFRKSPFPVECCHISDMPFSMCYHNSEWYKNNHALDTTTFGTLLKYNRTD